MDFNLNEDLILNDFEAFLENSKQLNQHVMIEILTKLVFCIIKQISKFPTIIRELIKKQFEEINQTFYNSHETFEPDIFKACKNGKLASVKWLIEKENVDKNSEVSPDNYFHYLDEEGNMPIHYATMSENLNVVQYLVEQQNVNVNSKGNGGRSPLHFACENGNLDIVKYLISKGANKEAKDDLGNTPLHKAANFNKKDIVKYLLDNGANKNITNNSAERPYDHASNNEIKQLLQ